MKTAAVALLTALSATSAFAQSGTNIPPGQNASPAINTNNYLANTDQAGYSEQSANGNVVGTGTTQATAQTLPTRVSVVSCAAGTGVALPALNRYTPITVLNRGTSSCLVYPTIGAALETAPGTLAAANAPFTLAVGADVTFRLVIVAGQVEWLQ